MLGIISVSIVVGVIASKNKPKYGIFIDFTVAVNQITNQMVELVLWYAISAS